VDADAIRAALDRMRRPGPPRIEVLQATGGRPEAVGLVPGSFDPLTVAHGALADALGTQLTLFVYSAVTLPKEPGPGGEAAAPLLAPEDRVSSLLAHCATSADLGVALCSHGLYADQAVAVAEAFPGSRLTFALGSDKLVQLVDPTWYSDRDRALNELFSRADVAYAVRAGDVASAESAFGILARWSRHLHAISLPAGVAGISSREVREAARRGADVSAMVPPAVLPFVRSAEA
jgi:nicotinamide-nucleotide adenylyltransferase